MFKLIPYLLIFIFILAPACSLIHEFGHAIIPLCKGLIVSINVGEGPSTHFMIGNLSTKIGLFKPWIGYAKWSEGNNNEIASLILGPIFSFLLTLVFLFIGFLKRTQKYSFLIFACAGWCLFQFVFTMIPLKYPEFLGYSEDTISDGRRVLDLKNKLEF